VSLLLHFTAKWVAYKLRLNEALYLYEQSMKLPEEILPILAKITDGKECELEFWKTLEGDSLIDMYMDLSSELIMSDIEQDSIPIGYVHLAYVFYWETNCQFSGWYAIENKQDEMPMILSCYEAIGLNSEAKALEAAVSEWFASEQDHDRVGAAYSSVPNKYSDEDDRFEYLADYFTKNATKILYA